MYGMSAQDSERAEKKYHRRVNQEQTVSVLLNEIRQGPHS